MIRVDVNPELLRWVSRARRPAASQKLAGRFQRLDDWEIRRRTTDPQAVGGLRPAPSTSQPAICFSARRRTSQSRFPTFERSPGVT